ncbi:MAG TPA: tetratricopeptide repeat protein, partial [Saprospiraceae bacterium]|nr:tetratricopeptide repeat protein [Saprospiraceae bacterium]
MNTSIRVVVGIAALLFAAIRLSAQNQSNVQDDLLRADKQFDLYAYNIARSSYEKVLQSDPNNARALARIADCYVQTNRPEEALPFYERATNAPGMDPEVMLRYGKALMMTGDYITAKTWFQFFAEGNPSVGNHFANMCDYAIAASNKDALYIPKLEPLNTEAADYAPVFYGNRIVYNSARTDIKRKTNAKSTTDWSGSSATNQPFVTQRNATDGFLQKPEFLRSDLQNTWNEGPLSFSADGKKVVFCRNNYINGARQVAEKGLTMSLYTADVDNGEWKNVRAFPYNGSDYATGFPCLSADGNTLWFASNRADGMGGWDIYVSEWTGTTWSTPSNLGAPLNTPGNEITPFFDGENLFFSSDYHRGFGGMDVFRAELQAWEVTNIFHLGPGVNSSRDDYGFVFSAADNIGYLTSNRPDGRGNEDIWQVHKKLDEFVITVLDEYRTPLADAEIDFSACGAGVMRTNAAGQYSFAVTSGQADCNAAVKKAGYQSTDLAIRSSGKKNLTVTLNTLPSADVYREPEPSPSNAALSSRSGIPAQPQQPASYATESVAPESADGSLVDHSLTLYDAMGQPLSNARVDLSTCALGSKTTDASGSIAFQLPAGTTCCMVVSKKGYEEAVIPITSSSFGAKSVSLSPLSAPIVPIAAGTSGTYTGSVMDGESMNEVPAVTVKAQKLPNGQIMTTSTNNLGRYIFNLEAGGYYQFTFLKKGYQQEVMNYLVSVNNTARTIAPVILQPGAGTTPAAPAVAETPAQYNTSPQMAPAPQASPAKMMAAKTAPVATPTPATTTGYAVQLAAQPQEFSQADIKKYNSLQPLGNLYTVQDDKMSRLRLGVFATKAEAETVNKQVQQTVKGSFVVPEKNADPQLVVNNAAAAPATYSTESVKSSSAKGAPVVGTQPLSAAPQVTPASNPIRYAVQ